MYASRSFEDWNQISTPNSLHWKLGIFQLLTLVSLHASQKSHILLTNLLDNPFLPFIICNGNIGWTWTPAGIPSQNQW